MVYYWEKLIEERLKISVQVSTNLVTFISFHHLMPCCVDHFRVCIVFVQSNFSRISEESICNDGKYKFHTVCFDETI